LPFFWGGLFKTNLLTLIAIIKYYLNALIRCSWKSKRLKKISRRSKTRFE